MDASTPTTAPAAPAVATFTPGLGSGSVTATEFGSETTRPVTVKIPSLDYGCMVVVAAYDEVQVSDWIRRAIDDFFDLSTADTAALHERVRAARERHSALTHTLESVLVDPDRAQNTPLPPVRKQEPGAKKGLTVRLGAHHLHRCAALAMLDDTSVAEQVRFAINHALSQRIGNQDARQTFTQRADASRHEARSALRGLLR